ncbi:MAG: hypothetical protein P8127_08480 [Acidobacteriota bacterium]
MRSVPVALLSIATACAGAMSDEQPVMTAADLGALPQPAADHRLRYGDDPLQFAELRLPPTPGPHPVVIVIHGGCWLAEYGLDYMSSFADASPRPEPLPGTSSTGEWGTWAEGGQGHSSTSGGPPTTCARSRHPTTWIWSESLRSAIQLVGTWPFGSPDVPGWRGTIRFAGARRSG